MDVASLNAYLHKNIPLTEALGAYIVLAEQNKVIISAPLLFNINHQKTVFGGSLNAVATLAAWSLVYINLQKKQISADIVIVKSEIKYLIPVTENFEAISNFENPENWNLFYDRLKRFGKSKIKINASISQSEATAVAFEGVFAALIK